MTVKYERDSADLVLEQLFLVIWLHSELPHVSLHDSGERERQPQTFSFLALASMVLGLMQAIELRETT